MNFSRQKQNLVLLGSNQTVEDFLGNTYWELSNNARCGEGDDILLEPPAMAMFTILLFEVRIQQHKRRSVERELR